MKTSVEPLASGLKGALKQGARTIRWSLVRAIVSSAVVAQGTSGLAAVSRIPDSEVSTPREYAVFIPEIRDTLACVPGAWSRLRTSTCVATVYLDTKGITNGVKYFRFQLVLPPGLELIGRFSPTSEDVFVSQSIVQNDFVLSYDDAGRGVVTVERRISSSRPPTSFCKVAIQAACGYSARTLSEGPLTWEIRDTQVAENVYTGKHIPSFGAKTTMVIVPNANYLIANKTILVDMNTDPKGVMFPIVTVGIAYAPYEVMWSSNLSKPGVSVFTSEFDYTYGLYPGRTFIDYPRGNRIDNPTEFYSLKPLTGVR
jgi:hypothetical protein